MREDRNELHLTLFDNGHVLSTDCWCEPNRVFWAKVSGVDDLTLCVEHNDEVPMSRSTVLHDRELGNDWITRVLSIGPPMLPPTEGD